MTNELKIRQIKDPIGDWVDAWTKWGLRLTADSKELHKRGTIQAYSYQPVNSNNRRNIIIKDENGKAVRECASMTLSVYTDKDWVLGLTDFTSIEAAWENFVEFISSENLEISSIAGGLVNSFSLDGEVVPVPTYGDNGSWRYVTCGIQFKQLTAK